MSTDEGTPKAAYTAAARGAAARRAVTQREDEADSEANAKAHLDQVEDSGEEAHNF